MLLSAILIDVLARRFSVAGGLINYFGGIMGGVGLMVFFLTIWIVTKGKGIGFGDVKLGFVIGMIFGLLHGAFIIYLAALLGGMIAILLLVSRRANMKTKLPLGTFISLSAIMYILLEQPINNLINSFFM